VHYPKKEENMETLDSASQVPSQQGDYFYLRHLQEVKGNAGRYYNQRFIGKGGNGTAFLVTCDAGKSIGMQMVMKVFHKISDDKRRQAFLQEISLLRNIAHPAIISIYDEGEYIAGVRKFPFAVVEYLPLSLRHAIVSNEIERIKAIRIIMALPEFMWPRKPSFSSSWA
jgi:serine/threonine protein kinase